MTTPAAILRAHPLAPEPQPFIRYRAGYKYQLAQDYAIKLLIVGCDVETDYLRLRPDGWLTIREGYAWDGCSGPTIDTPSTMRGGLVHDALYQLIRLGKIDKGWRDLADDTFRWLLIDDGMWRWRAWLYWRAVSNLAVGATRPSAERAIRTAP